MSGTDYTLTPNLSLFKPIANAAINMWGTYLNANADALDTVLGHTAGGPFLPLAGGTVTGPITLAADPTAALQAATKQYADKMLPLAGGTVTGNLTVAQISMTGVTYPDDVSVAALPAAGAGGLMMANDAINPVTNTSTGPQLVHYTWDSTWRLVGRNEIAQTTPYTTIQHAPGVTSDASGNLSIAGALQLGPIASPSTLNFSRLPDQAANDAAAATAGVPVGGTYRNGSALQVRVT
jgi:hypothetical protein